MKKTSKRLLGRVITVILAVLIQVIWLIFAVVVLRNRFPFIATVINVVSVAAILWKDLARAGHEMEAEPGASGGPEPSRG